MEIFMYRCEFCGVAVFAQEDHERVWYRDCCGICKTWTYYEKVLIKENMFVLEEKKDVI